MQTISGILGRVQGIPKEVRDAMDKSQRQISEIYKRMTTAQYDALKATLYRSKSDTQTG